ncbi:MAG: pilus assembly protein TadG-related protein [Bryobacteraceae bacterium]|jgi:hypothetical protein
MQLRKTSQRGQVLPLATLLIIMLLSMMGLAMETGLAFYLRQSAHAAAEAAAMAAVEAAATSVSGTSVTCGTASSGVQCGSGSTAASETCAASPTSPPQTNFDNACLYAKQNGFAVGGNTTVKIMANNTSPAPDAPNVSVVYWAEAVATTRQTQMFSSLFSSAGLFAGARATAALVSTGGGGGSGCIYVLDKANQSRALDVEGAEIITSCGIYVNSSNSSAIFIGGNPTVGSYAIQASSINIVGNLQNAGQGLVSPTPLTGQTAVADPLASLTPPTVGSCNHTNFNWSTGTTTLSPGVYCGGISISGGTVTFTGGEYILNGGGLQINSANTTVTGSGVSFYNTATTGYSFGTMTISGQPSVTFSAPTSGSMQGIFWFSDRSDTNTAQNQINGATNSTIQGTIYIPTAPLLYTGESSTSTYTGIVVYTLEVNGATYFKQDTTGQYTGLGSSTVTPFLIE